MGGDDGGGGGLVSLTCGMRACMSNCSTLVVTVQHNTTALQVGFQLLASEGYRAAVAQVSIGVFLEVISLVYVGDYDGRFFRT